MNAIYSKYNLLDIHQKKQVDLYLDSLLNTKQTVLNKKESRTEYQNKLLQVSQWSEEDISLILIKN